MYRLFTDDESVRVETVSGEVGPIDELPLLLWGNGALHSKEQRSHNPLRS